MSGIRFTKAEREAIRRAFEEVVINPPKGYRAAMESVLSKLDAAEVAPRKKSTALSVGAAIEVLRGVLGRRLVLPPGKLTAGWCAQMSNFLGKYGLTHELLKTAAVQASYEWQGNIKAESVIRQADKLIHNFEAERALGGAEPPGGWQGAEPFTVDLDDEEL